MVDKVVDAVVGDVDSGVVSDESEELPGESIESEKLPSGSGALVELVTGSVSSFPSITVKNKIANIIFISLVWPYMLTESSRAEIMFLVHYLLCYECTLTCTNSMT